MEDEYIVKLLPYAYRDLDDIYAYIAIICRTRPICPSSSITLMPCG